jgi:hypothetical protein
LTGDFKTAPLADTASAPPGRSGRLAATRERGSELNTSRRQAGRRISRKKVAAECGQPHRPATNYTARAVAGRAAATRPACMYRQPCARRQRGAGRFLDRMQGTPRGGGGEVAGEAEVVALRRRYRSSNMSSVNPVWIKEARMGAGPGA